MMSGTDLNLKKQYGWSVRLLIPFAPPFAHYFHRIGISANSVSWLSLFAFLIGILVYVQSDTRPALKVLAAALFTFGTLLDVVDGYVARLNKVSGKFGAYLDAGIDILRYNIFLVVVWKYFSSGTVEHIVILLYAIMLNLSFLKLFINIGKSHKNNLANSIYEKTLPSWYINFCEKNKLLFNPFNLEDQLLFFIFIIGVIFNIEALVIALCLLMRAAEISYAIYFKSNH